MRCLSAWNVKYFDLHLMIKFQTKKHVIKLAFQLAQNECGCAIITVFCFALQDVRNVGKRITEDLRHVMAQPLAQQEGYKLEVRLTKIRVGNQEGPVYGESRHSYAKEEKIYSVPTRRNLAARQLHEGCFLPIDPVCRKTKSSQQKELVRLVAQNHERNNVAIKPSRKDLRDM